MAGNISTIPTWTLFTLLQLQMEHDCVRVYAKTKWKLHKIHRLISSQCLTVFCLSLFLVFDGVRPTNNWLSTNIHSAYILGYMATSTLCLVLHCTGTNEYEIWHGEFQFLGLVWLGCVSVRMATSSSSSSSNNGHERWEINICTSTLKTNFNHNSLNSHFHSRLFHFFFCCCCILLSLVVWLSCLCLVRRCWRWSFVALRSLFVCAFLRDICEWNANFHLHLQ